MSAAERIDRVPELRRALSDARQVCAALDLMKGAKRNQRGLLVCCPSHGERNASCSVKPGPDGTLMVRCFSCEFAGDVFHLIAAARGLDTNRDFPEVLKEAAAIAGMVDLFEEPPVPLRAVEKAPSDRVYPLASEVASIWQGAKPVTQSAEVSAHLESRGLDPARLAELDAARALREGANLPRWACYRGDAEVARPWFETGHRLLLPTFDPTGKMTSVRAGRVIDGDSPKRLPPSGHRQSGLVLANKAARAMLGHGAIGDLLIVEGEPDFLTWCAAPVAVIGIGSGSWSRDFANRIPAGTYVVIRTHQDRAGDAYATEVGRTLVRRCTLLRPAPDGLGDENDRLRAGTLAPAYDFGSVPFTVETVDPLSFFLGRLFAEYAWLGDELRPGVFAARCPAEELHEGGARFDGSTVIHGPSSSRADGHLTCQHSMCRRQYDSIAEVGNAIQRIAQAEGL